MYNLLSINIHTGSIFNKSGYANCIKVPALTNLMSSVQIGNVVTIQAASVQEQLQRIQQLREQQQQKKRQAAEAKREQALNAASQSDIIQKQVCASKL